MKTQLHYFLLTICLSLISSFSAFSQDTDQFKTDVETTQKPWTNLEFYDDPANFQFAIVSDNAGGMRPGVFELAVEKLNMMMPEFVLSVGDLIQGYTEDTIKLKKEQDDFDQKVEKLQMPFFYLPGNHDINNLVMQKEWEDRYGRRYYYFTYKDVLFLILDSNDDDEHNLTDTQTSFAIEAINAHPDVRWTFVLMHHPIWKYDTDGKFGKIEEALSNRKHTVIAGHEHHYQYIERKESNYYVLATTGGGSKLIGNRFGSFDHFVWMTMTDNGPVMANLRLDGILAHDITNATTEKMARSMLSNTNFKFLVLTNQDKKFNDGTAYLHFNNTADVPLNVDLSFYHHHQIDIQPSLENVKLKPGEQKVIEIALEAHEPVAYEELGFLQYYWKLSYDGAEYKDFYLDGNADFSITPSTPDYFIPQTRQFVGNVEFTFKHPFDLLKSEIKINGEKSEMESFPEKFPISESTTLEVTLTNEKNQATAIVVKSYSKVSFLRGKKVKRAVPGLTYAYYEGNWSVMPDFDNLVPVKQGITDDFDVEDIAVNKNNFGIRFTGYFDAPEEGMYYFRCRADDAASLKIHDKMVCQDGTSEVFENKNNEIGPIGAIALKEGMHPIEIDFMDNQGGERLRFYYKMSESADWNFMELEELFRTTESKQ